MYVCMYLRIYVLMCACIDVCFYEFVYVYKCSWCLTCTCNVDAESCMHV